MTSFANAVPRAEPTSEELVQELRAGRQQQVVVHGNDVVFGWATVSAAKAVGLTTIAVVECDGGDGRHSSELLLIAAKFHLEAAIARLTPDEFTAQMMRAALYDAWVRNSTRRPPRPTSPAKAQARRKRREELILEAFGVAKRTLERYVVLARLAPELRDFVRSEEIPMWAVEDVGRLPLFRQREFATRLKKGGSFAKLRTEFLGDGDGRRKTGRSAAGAIRSSIHTLVLEACGRKTRTQGMPGTRWPPSGPGAGGGRTGRPGGPSTAKTRT